MRKINRTFLGLTIIILIYLLFVLPNAINKSYRGDEIIFIYCANSVLETGKPVYDGGQFVGERDCLWHPPLYIYLLSAFLLILGKSMLYLRLLSIIFNILVIVLVYLITKIMLGENKNKHYWALLASALYALNPLTIQSSIILDIDGSLLNFLLVLFFYCCLKFKQEIYLIIPLFFLFWTKFQGIIILFGSFFLFFLFRKNWKDLFRMVKLFFITGILFLASFLVYCWSTGMNFKMPFVHNSIIAR